MKSKKTQAMRTLRLIKVPVQAYLDPEQAAELRALSDRTRVPAQAYIREGIDVVLAKHGRQQAETIQSAPLEVSAGATASKAVKLTPRTSRERDRFFDEWAAKLGFESFDALVEHVNVERQRRQSKRSPRKSK